MQNILNNVKYLIKENPKKFVCDEVNIKMWWKRKQNDIKTYIHMTWISGKKTKIEEKNIT